MAKKTWTKDTKNGNTFWLSGDGMIRRDHNIEVVKNLIKSGLSYEEIIKLSRRKFRTRTIDEYFSIAQDEINAESESESATDYMKRKKTEKGVKK